MRKLAEDILFAMIMGLILPGLILGAVVALRQGGDDGRREDALAHQAESGPNEQPLRMLFRDGDGQVTQMDMDTYLVGVVCGEMPASFETEALKAQAVVARTYTLKAGTTGGKHGDGSVCTDYRCCQAYVSGEAYTGSEADLEKIRRAVYGTSGQVLTYQGGLIEATYFSCSGGSTEDAAAVWGSDYPYLRATQSPGEEAAAHYTDTVFIPREALAQALDISLTGPPEGWIGLTTYTAGGGVNTMVIGGREFRGTQLRTALGLRSTAFTVAAGDTGVAITTRGYGHRVGMSQYGADAMAALGADYAGILAHYYAGTELTQWRE